MWLLKTVLLSCIITLGWTLMFTVPKRYILPCLLMTGFGFGLKTALEHYHLPLPVASFFGAMLSSFLGVYFSKKYTLPPKALISPSVICMMPGIPAYKAMVSMVQIGYFGFSDALFSQMMSYFFEALFITSALVLGLSIPGLLFYRRRPIV
ncbi:hypothetical protein DLE54_09510 [Psychrobacter sp. YP14]|jgi:uncharacterized membrane protein YjjB (DUF3815 family)|uniref:Threonine/serine exporter n=3 Tax=Psychrobacter TaxID=497 RepID=A0A844M2T6_9GAMM|nr:MULTISPECIES: threonine/serine exporter family protein [Psychrobacter]AWT49719.1 hypothetical protein DLE54_09510 [Psychrobacter sp. YP14]MUG32928.1 threonine/serine exporter [Psychrobacter sanguinis]